ncbi:hypothetical protein Defa_28650 [Desulfovibrio sp. TH_2024_36128]|uniref:Uncharacterized protein n=1 Tax=Desulfovibrio falkowii TaxID=3136602 RepID=A0ABQ0EC85_9BACT
MKWFNTQSVQLVTIRYKSLHCIKSIEFIVSLGNENVFNKVLEVDPMRFHNLVNLPPEKSHRKQNLLAIAEEMIPL